ncbi:sensor histidine kinase [Gordonibacter sp. An230]|uniref:sensor histidine kinase n=1 Tax=Gordonibacter sp. An230 TaxID=1965592 RepID=UPI000B381071|nr:HAMP domain-containing sensor histidine kinase [Gordonibacter sp. An230]OUO91435.1 sensor histidine kinase [Gordonibacter sp. An230]
MEAILAVLLALALSAAALLAARLALLKCSIRQTSAELAEIAERIEDNRMARLPQPCAELEGLLEAVNRVLEAAQERQVECARQEDRLKSQVESLSHDLRTPLTAMVGYLALMDGDALDDDARASLDTVRRKTAALQRLVAQFYELSQARGGDARLEIGEMDVCRAVREALSERHRLLSERGLDVRVDLPARPVFALADPSALERVLENLLGNVGAYAKGSFEAAVSVRGDGRVVVTMANDADELSESEMERLFEPFFTADAARGGESSGLGLAIARSLSELMGASLDATAQRRDGAFWLRFDLVLEPGRPCAMRMGASAASCEN